MHDHGHSIFQHNIRRGVDCGFMSFNADRSRVTYHLRASYTTSYKNPEEKVRAAYVAELLRVLFASR